MTQNAMEILEQRGYIDWCSNRDGLAALYGSEMVTAYVGFDPTADSLHVGHLIPLMGLAWMQRLGHRPIAIAGAGTGLIGDPSGKSKERNLLTLEKMAENLAAVKPQLAHFLDFDCGKNSALMVNNYDWLGKLGFIEFLRDTGKHFSVNYLISKEYVKSRLDDPEKSISFTEFSYTLLQAYDFWHLCRTYNCRLQMGGNDQQGNIVSGIELIRKKEGIEAFGGTNPLLLTSSGVKFGKTEDGAVWLDPAKTSPYKFYQFWINTEDAAIAKLLKFFTFLPLDEIADIAAQHAASPEKRAGQKVLAAEVTKIVHGEGALATARKASDILFGGDLEPADLTNEMLDALAGEVPTGNVAALPAPLVDLLVESGSVPSKSEARRLIRGGGVSLNGRKIDDEAFQATSEDLLAGKRLFVRIGKKRIHLIHLA